jgi:hypothetical protein
MVEGKRFKLRLADPVSCPLKRVVDVFVENLGTSPLVRWFRRRLKGLNPKPGDTGDTIRDIPELLMGDYPGWQPLV